MITKSNLIDTVSKKNGIDKVTVESTVNAALKAIEEALKSGEKVQLIGFGTFEVKERAAREGRNPFTGEKMEIPASKHLSFTAGKTLKDSLNDKSDK